MRGYRAWIAVALALAPVVGRTLWYYRGLYRPSEPIELPAFAEFTPPQPPIAAPDEPIEAVEPESTAGQAARPPVVLFDQSHSNRFSLAELRSLTAALAERGARVEVLDSSSMFDELGLEGRLKYASAFVVVAPSLPYAPAEIAAVEGFVERGGRLVVVLDPTRTGSGLDLFGFLFLAPADDVAAANQLLRSFDLSFSDDYLYNLGENEGNFRNVFLREFGDHPLTAGLETVALYAARSVTTLSGTPLLSADPAVFSSRTDAGGGLAGAAVGPGGQSLAIGDLTFMSPPYDTVADNARFIQNLADFLIGGERQLDLRDLPFVFTRPVLVVGSADFAVQAETLAALRGFAAGLGQAGVELDFSDAPLTEHDRLVLGLFDPDPELDGLIGPLGIDLPRDTEDGMLQVPGFGSVNPAGLGLVGLYRSDDRTTLVLLGETQQDLVTLLETVGQGLVGDCLRTPTFALCHIGAGPGLGAPESFDFGFGLEESFNE
jgi:hypothetical protein